MAKKPFEIRIESILGGMSNSLLYAGQDEYGESFAVDPDSTYYESFSFISGKETLLNQPMGAISPVKSRNISGLTAGATSWIVPPPVLNSSPGASPDYIYVYDSVGSVYVSTSSTAIIGLGDLNDGGDASGNGAEYYDNYMYFARDTTIARYGPMDGTASFTDDYWSGTLSKTALTNNLYPKGQYAPSDTPNHILKRHSDGRMYIGDVVDNQGVIHYISTTKTTTEGDTDNGSKYNALDLPYGYWPTAIESFGDQLVIALCDGNINGRNYFNGQRAKIVFWDTVSDSYNLIIDFQYPDPFISKIMNVNGELYIFSGYASQELGMRVTKYIGGISFQEVAYYKSSYLPSPGAFAHDLKRIYFGSNYTPVDPTNSEASYGRPAINAIGSVIGSMGGVHSVMGVNSSMATNITSLSIGESGFWAGWSGIDVGGISKKGAAVSDNIHGEKNVWRSSYFRVGRRFKLNKLKLDFVQQLQDISGNSTSKEVTPSIWVDSGSFVHTLTTINETNYPDINRSVVIRPENLVGENGFFLHCEWDTDEPLSIALPIVIEGEYLDD